MLRRVENPNQHTDPAYIYIYNIWLSGHLVWSGFINDKDFLIADLWTFNLKVTKLTFRVTADDLSRVISSIISIIQSSWRCIWWVCLYCTHTHLYILIFIHVNIYYIYIYIFIYSYVCNITEKWKKYKGNCVKAIPLWTKPLPHGLMCYIPISLGSLPESIPGYLMLNICRKDTYLVPKIMVSCNFLQ